MAFILLAAFAAVATVLYLHRLDAGHEFREDGAMLLAWTTATTRKVLAATRQAQSAWPEVRQSVSHQLGHLPETLGAIRFGAREIGKPRVENGPPSADFIEALEAILADDLARREAKFGLTRPAAMTPDLVQRAKAA